MLVGPSRKRLTAAAVWGNSASPKDGDRDWATAGACAAAVGLGADIVRAHSPRVGVDEGGAVITPHSALLYIANHYG